ncbi:ABC transporter substrate-binding protein [Candidatus Cetobacterium colombiensis]|uniref:ABC transporter substrate-binding protein n=1 Tax=Candidatus Cetobacterium colombiensis TaxID=3073100 RepID=A0ABU4WE14_9FUSO|nr:ABC transporter substrate-binding protein [Candidatus Cetobacterium colombiensis]MDX8337444.1 ABC transporter substrate-binding protein [Candidatus Cetobacterium colombiensis]
MKKSLSVILGMALINIVSFGKPLEIGISQIVEHPALDAVRIGVEEGLKKSELEFKLDSQIAQGDMTVQQLIMNNFKKNKKDFIVAISTPTLQSAINTTNEIPILFGAITSPELAGVTSDKINVTGVSDRVPPELMVNLAKEILPSAKTIGIIYNPSEKNSEFNVGLLKEITKNNNMTLVDVGITSTNELPSALDVVLNKSDVLFTITDNLTVSSAPFILSKAKVKKIPVISMNGEEMVKEGALGGFKVDYKGSGVIIGEMIGKIVNGEKITDIPVFTPLQYPILINESVAKELGIKIPEKLLENNL